MFPLQRQLHKSSWTTRGLCTYTNMCVGEKGGGGSKGGVSIYTCTHGNMRDFFLLLQHIFQFLTVVS